MVESRGEQGIARVLAVVVEQRVERAARGSGHQPGRLGLMPDGHDRRLATPLSISGTSGARPT